MGRKACCPGAGGCPLLGSGTHWGEQWGCTAHYSQRPASWMCSLPPSELCQRVCSWGLVVRGGERGQDDSWIYPLFPLHLEGDGCYSHSCGWVTSGGQIPISGLPVKLGSWSWGGDVSLRNDALEGSCRCCKSSLCVNLHPDAPCREADMSPEQSNFWASPASCASLKGFLKEGGRGRYTGILAWP